MIALVDERLGAREERALMLSGATVIRLPRSKYLSEAVCSHPDMLLFYNRGHIITSADWFEESPWALTDVYELVRGIRITCTSEVHGHDYPSDAIFNALVCGEHIFYKEDTVSEAIKKHAARNNLTPVPVKQGYPACTSLAFGGAMITADKGMAEAARNVGIRVTLIENGDILLPPYEYGFIGGAAGVYRDSVYFIGNIERHRDFQKIDEAIRSEGFTHVSLSDGPLQDLGRIIFIDDRIN